MRLLIVTIALFGLLLATPAAAAPEDIEGLTSQPCRPVFIGGKGTLDSCTGDRWSGTKNPTSYIGSVSPPADFCTFAPCIGAFWDGRGTVVLCVDGKYSKSGGRQGACNQHHGVAVTEAVTPAP
jgi:hypothetical protein